MSSSWCTIESDPGVFSELLTLFGVKNAEVEELYTLEADLQNSARSFGLIFLFKWVQETDDRPTLSYEDCPDLFYAKQVIHNACATQAILSVLLNATDIELGDTLEQFKSFTMGLDPETKGLAIGNSDTIRQAHNAFAPQTSFDPDAGPRSRHAKEDAYHFIAYVPCNGIVYELDGLKAGPILLGAVSEGNDWFSVATPAIEERMMRYSSSEISFALLNICPKKSLVLGNELASKRAELESLEQSMVDGEDADIDKYKSVLRNELAQLEEQLRDDEFKLMRQREENKRRRHDYLPFINTLLCRLSEKGKLAEMVVAGKVKATQAAESRARRKANSSEK